MADNGSTLDSPALKQAKPAALPLAALAAILLACAAVALACCVYRASLPLEIDPNEAWNAWLSKPVARLYPDADALTVNNYPPLYFYLLHGLSLLGAEEVYAGRAISLLASLALTYSVYRTIAVLGVTGMAAGAGAAWFLATLAGAFTGYAGMNDPHLCGLAVMGAGFCWFAARTQKGLAAEPAIVLMALAGFIKHDLIALPASALIWLALDRPRAAARALACGVAACGAGLLICYAAFGDNFFHQLMMPRVVGWQNLDAALAHLKPLAGAMAVSAVWIVYDWRDGLARKMAVLLGLTLASGFVQSLGDGVDVNACFELLFALAIGLGLAFGKMHALGVRLAFGIALLLALSLSSQREPYRFAFSPEFRKDVSENVKALKAEVRRVKAIKGDLSCSVMLVCYWAGKRFVWDDFAMHERVATGRWTQAELDRQARLHRIRFEKIDERYTW